MHIVRCYSLYCMWRDFAAFFSNFVIGYCANLLLRQSSSKQMLKKAQIDMFCVIYVELDIFQ